VQKGSISDSFEAQLAATALASHGGSAAELM
jgi:hypothetical protein